MELRTEESLRVISEAIENSEQSWLAGRKKNQKIDAKSARAVFYLTQGAISFYRVEDDVLSLTIHAPSILGLNQLREDSYTHYMRCEEECKMWVMSNEDAVSLFNEMELWRFAFDIMIKHLHLYLKHEYRVNQKGVKGVVFEHLRHIWSLPENERRKISIYTFILSRNHISRSAIHKAVADLEKSGNISVSRGKLLSFNEQADTPPRG